MWYGVTVSQGVEFVRLAGCKFAGRPFKTGPLHTRTDGRLRFARYRTDSPPPNKTGRKACDTDVMTLRLLCGRQVGPQSTASPVYSNKHTENESWETVTGRARVLGYFSCLKELSKTNPHAPTKREHVHRKECIM